MKEIKHTLTLTFTLKSFEEYNCPGLATMLQYCLNDIKDGRHAFDAETLFHGLNNCLKQAIRCTVEREAQAEFGREVVTSDDGRSRTSKWYLESRKHLAKALKKLWLSVDDAKVRIS